MQKTVKDTQKRRIDIISKHSIASYQQEFLAYEGLVLSKVFFETDSRGLRNYEHFLSR